MKKIVSVIYAVIIIISLNSSAFAETVSGRGYENASYTFYAKATGNNATIYFKQKKARAVLNYINFLTDEWGCYHIYYTYAGRTYSTEWNNVKWNADNETFSLDLPFKGVYKIQIVAYSAEEINDLYAITHFTGWFMPISGGTGPSWWVENCYNCWVSNSPIQDPTPTPTVTPRKMQTTPPPTNTPKPSSNGQGSSSSNYSGRSFPDRWDTVFKPGTCQTDNVSAINRLDRLHDGNASTVFHYLIWRSEWNNRYTQPQFTAYFSNGCINGIGLINGDTSSYSTYRNNARVRVMKVVVYTGSGVYTHEFNVPDNYDRSYQYFGFGRQYSNVGKVEIHITGTHDGIESLNNICIGDMCFY